ncbi:aminotransferase class V-fold PLP-dependent enzyme [Thalassotalea sp. G2M2-11]|uniref:aminotransferase class V-fold PLP-dependent enzyme n=1 Tax=Thalassotalea sp. G2M2-11 TaxID=2787627 RepID=UPI0019D17E4C|nr:aminotransferase class V-fold PLP-dependent enzyme [Thalassotalea sp. G2M2-11]
MTSASPWKQDFPIFSSHAHPSLCYLDSAATCLTPKHVADAVYHYQCYSHANSHKGLYQLSANVTEKVEHARETVADFIGATSGASISFNSGTTEGINLIAFSFVEPILSDAYKKGKPSNLVISAVEHHANLLPWQRLAERYQAELRVVKITDEGIMDLAHLSQLLDNNTRVLAFSHCSNVLGRFNPAEQICRIAKRHHVPTIVDGAQAVAHGKTNVSAIDCDFYVFSAHKLYGPTGCGVMYGKTEHFEQMRPYQLGGGIVSKVNFTESDFVAGATKFEPGSHHVAGIVGLVEAIEYLHDISWPDIQQHMEKLALYLNTSLNELPYYQPLIVPSAKRLAAQPTEVASIVSFRLKNVHCHDVASLLDSNNIAVRAGHHCAQPLHETLGVTATVRASLGLYNDFSDVDKLVAGLDQAYQLMTG